MNTDLELLQLAAKAAGYEINFDDSINDYFIHGYDDNGDPHSWWNPLIDDGDALRLSVRLHIHLRHMAYFTEDGNVQAGIGMDHLEGVEYSGDAISATRRAIVLAASEIGKAMP